MSKNETQVLDDTTFEIPEGVSGFRRALLLNPPVYDAQYWARWSQPAGLLRIASLLRKKGYTLDLIDCMETDHRGFVPKSYRVNGATRHVTVDDVSKRVYHFGLTWEQVKTRMRALPAPDEVWITSVMTYWWESTRDAVLQVREAFPLARILVGGIYPTLAPEHAARWLGADVVFKGELKEASDEWTDLSLYATPPTYAILTTSRGCPWDCHYCAARKLNGGSAKMRSREAEDVLAEIAHKKDTFGIRHFGFYEDNALALRGHLREILEGIVEQHRRLHLYAPEGFETRLLDEDLLRSMKRAGFKKVHLPFETLKLETNIGWNRRHASTASFEAALDAAIRAGFAPRTSEINAFVLFGLPDDSLQDIVDNALYIHHTVGSIIPMLFTPVPGTRVFTEHEGYFQERGWGLERLNGKYLPFLEYNRQRYPGLRASDYLDLEGMMSILNAGKFLSRTVNLCDGGATSRGFQAALRRTSRPLQLVG